MLHKRGGHTTATPEATAVAAAAADDTLVAAPATVAEAAALSAATLAEVEDAALPMLARQATEHAQHILRHAQVSEATDGHVDLPRLLSKGTARC